MPEAISPGMPLTIGDLAERTGLAVSAIRFYETKGLVTPARNSGGQRRYLRSDIRRLSFVLIAQQLGFSIEDIRAALATLPAGRAPTQKDWERISRNFRGQLDERIVRSLAAAQRDEPIARDDDGCEHGDGDQNGPDADADPHFGKGGLSHVFASRACDPGGAAPHACRPGRS